MRMKSGQRLRLTTLLLSMIACSIDLQALPPADESLLPEKVALVIGNSGEGVGEISGQEDAEAMAKFLKSRGFFIIGKPPYSYYSISEMQDAANKLYSKSHNASEVVFYYSGHGFVVNGENYLLPDGYAPPTGIPLLKILEAFNGAPDTAKRFAFFDACRKISPSNPPQADDLEENKNEANNACEETKGCVEKPEYTAGLVKIERPRPTLISYSAPYGTAVESGREEGELSPYTEKLIALMREPGLELSELTRRLTAEVKQIPVSYGEASFREGEKHYLTPPIELDLHVKDYDDNVIAFLGGDLVVSTSNKDQETMPLAAGKHKLQVYVTNGNTFRNGLTWLDPEGWSYDVRLDHPEDEHYPYELLWENSATSKDTPPRLHGGESAPFKNGPRHGGVFKVAEATVNVTSETECPESDYRQPCVRVETCDEFWRGDAWFANDQEKIWDLSLAELQAQEKKSFTPVINLWVGAHELLRTLDAQEHIDLPDPARVYGIVMGNKKLLELGQELIDACEKETIEDLDHSFSRTLAGDPRPFDSFDEKASECLREAAETAGWSESLRKEIKVWSYLYEDKEAVAQEDLFVPSSDPLRRSEPGEILLGPVDFDLSVEGTKVPLATSLSFSFKDGGETLDVGARVVGQVLVRERLSSALQKLMSFDSESCAKSNGALAGWHAEATRLALEGRNGPLNAKLDLIGTVEFCHKLPLLPKNISGHVKADIDASLVPDGKGGLLIQFDRPRLQFADALTKSLADVAKFLTVDLEAELQNALHQQIGISDDLLALPEDLQQLGLSVSSATFSEHEGHLLATVEAKLPLDKSALKEGKLQAYRK